MNYLFKKTPESARNDKNVLEHYLNGHISKRKAKQLIAQNNHGQIMSDEEFNELFNLGWYQEALDKHRTKWLKQEGLHQV